MKVIKLFWIDDMENWADAAKNNLVIVANKYGIDLKVVHAANGEDVVQQLNSIDFDGVIMDYNMEPSRGDKYIDDVRFEEHLGSIPIIFYSQDNTTDLDALVKKHDGIVTVFRPNLEDKIKEFFF